MNKAKLIRACDAISIRYPIFQIFTSHKVISYFILFSYLALLIFSILWSFDLPQKLFKVKAINGVPDGIFTGVIELSALLFFSVILLILKILLTSSKSENQRRISKLDRVNNVNIHEINDFHLYPVDEKAKVTFSFSYENFYTLPSILDASYKWIALDKAELFLIEAGSLDIPKLTLKKLNYDRIKMTLEIELGVASFYDIFYTHYSPDLKLSSQSPNESNKPSTLRSIYENSIVQYYNSAHDLFSSSGEFTPLSLLPNPIGISGIVIISTKTDSFVILRRRGENDILDRNRIEWSFAGLIEATDWIHTKSIPFIDFARSELDDEVTKQLPILETQIPDISTIGFILNPDCLYQQELFVTVKYKLNEKFTAILKDQISCKSDFFLIKVSQLDDTFNSAEQIKNICFSGLELLKKSQLYSDLNNKPN